MNYLIFIIIKLISPLQLKLIAHEPNKSKSHAYAHAHVHTIAIAMTCACANN